MSHNLALVLWRTLLRPRLHSLLCGAGLQQ